MRPPAPARRHAAVALLAALVIAYGTAGAHAHGIDEHDREAEHEHEPEREACATCATGLDGPLVPAAGCAAVRVYGRHAAPPERIRPVSTAAPQPYRSRAPPALR